MTDQSPSPTTRMPVPGSPDDPPTGDRAATTAVGDETEEELSAARPDIRSTSPPVAPPAVPPAPAVPPPARRVDRDHGRTASILFGVAILGIGLWFLAEHTLGIDMPTIRWSQIWPAILIVIGLWVVLGSMRRGSR